MTTIADKIGVSALLEQTAEECCELAQACLKMARKLRDENPTPKSVDDIRDDLVEEMADVQLCLMELMNATDITTEQEVINLEARKFRRWLKRLDQHINIEDI